MLAPMTKQVMHVLPHRGGGGESYVDMLERMSGFAHERFYLSAGRTPHEGLRSIPARWSRLALSMRRADLVHVHGDVASILALPLLRLRPSVVTTHGLHLLRRSQGARRRIVDRAMTSVASASRSVICTSGSELDELSELVRRADKEKLRVIRNGIDAPEPIEASARDHIRQELRVEPETVLGLFVGQLEPRKAPLLAAAAAREVRQQGIAFVLAVAGDGPQAAELATVAGDAVKPLGYRSDLPRLYAAADLFVQPSEREGISLALLEAMASGLAVIAADGPGNPEALGDTGLLFRAGDQPALGRCLIRLAGDPELRAALGARAKTRALEEFSADRFAAATRAVYIDALRGVSAPVRDVVDGHA